ncbi:MAG: OmpA family protein [Myxococcales bacterium]|nr:OmpA family protein [Myxococcales bacterium]
MQTALHAKLGSFLSLALVAATTVACGGDKPPPPKAPDAVTTSAPPEAPKNKLPAEAPASPNVSAVRISDEIVRLCGIKAPDAYFAFDSASLRKDDVSALDQVAVCFSTGPLKGRKLRVVGHTDPRGSAEYNMTLGQSRADAVAGYVAGKGLDKAKVESSSRGAMDAEGGDEPAWAKDRRVDLLLVPANP